MDPLFVDEDNNNFRLQDDSPCRNSGRYDGDRGALFEISSIESERDQPDNFILANNYPNPFNASTIIEYSLQKQSFVTIEIYDILGRCAATLVSEEKSAGSYQIAWHANNQSSGVYFYSIKTDGFVQTKKMTLLK
ncbi:MAG: T9SS type A sorting domain-containing protein [candidate division Zixibacteria bacterium]|nr:T9SS type A sorting domain-containing protein [candidate division Zixibacteria bacterium]